MSCNAKGYLLLETLIAIAYSLWGFWRLAPDPVYESYEHIFTQATLLAAETLEHITREPVATWTNTTYCDSITRSNEWGDKAEFSIAAGHR